ncbi:hypothetical protein JCGZ_18871 [Jatropha curcas]|uniref:Peroxidase n=1 Tax=Jatropha curcas TaxID=180498 RepID=A0A067JV10_JATCU|nr:hypothetical protein JCGZ_18871 [Jatropha curcas]
MAKLISYFGILLLIFLISPVLSVPLKKGFYKKSCPLAETIVRSTVKNAFANDTGIPPALIRLHFHDCFVRGCDASILLDSTPGSKAEKESMGNKGVGGFEVIDEAKAKMETYCPNTVSCADIIAFAARDSVLLAGGIYYEVPSGRRDGTKSLIHEVSKNLPDSFFNVIQLKDNFANKGLSLEEMVTLSGAHSIGDSHCSSFSKRLYSFNATHGQDPSMDSAYASFLKTKCPKPVNNGIDPLVSFDPSTPTRLDNNYYRNLKMNKGLLFSDQVLWSNSLTKSMVKSNINHPGSWASKFASAMVHMGSIEVITGSNGEVRKNCRVLNSYY